MTQKDTPLGLLSKIEGQYPNFEEYLHKYISNGTVPSDAAERYLVSRCCAELTTAPLMAAPIAAAYMWRLDKRMYVFDDTLAQLLVGQAEDLFKTDLLPAEILTALPVSAFYIKAPDLIAIGLDGFFVWCEEVDSENRTLQFVFLHDDMVTVTGGCLKLTGSVKKSLPDPDAWLYPHIIGAAHQDAAALHIVLGHMDPSGPAKHLIHNLLLRAVQLVIYLCCVNADLQPQEYPWPEKQDAQPVLPEVAAVAVGKRIGAELRRAGESKNTGRSRKAHTRRGHWHSYWIGPKNGERKLITKWIPPVFVGSKIADVDVIAVTQ